LRIADDYRGLRGAGFDHDAAFQALNRMRSARDDAAKRAAGRDFMGYKWGLGFGLSCDIDDGDRVNEAEITGGQVRITDRENVLPRIVLEGHHFVMHNGRDPASNAKDKEKATRGQGPFIAVQSSGDDVISGFGAGWMVGIRYKETSPDSFNLSLGLIVDRNVQTLGDGFDPNQPPPENETEIRYKTTSRLGLLFFASFSF
jgi:hypothetical protein